MSIKIIQERLDTYQAKSVQEEEQALREITQEVILAGLSRTTFFKTAAFQGGTALRVFYSLNRFLEDMDFTLREPNPAFALDPCVQPITNELKAYGFQFEIQDKSKADSAIQKLFIKDNSIGKILVLQHLKADRSVKKIRIKIEVDTNPPAEGIYETKFLQFPFAASVSLHNRETLFAGKMHALLCREYVKGRDWYDFIWYAGRGTPINFEFLAATLKQTGPWQGQEIAVDKNWSIEYLKQKICSIDWDKARADVRPFINPREFPSLEVWGEEFFLDRLGHYAQRN